MNAYELNTDEKARNSQGCTNGNIYSTCKKHGNEPRSHCDIMHMLMVLLLYFHEQSDYNHVLFLYNGRTVRCKEAYKM